MTILFFAQAVRCVVCQHFNLHLQVRVLKSLKPQFKVCARSQLSMCIMTVDLGQQWTEGPCTYVLLSSTTTVSMYGRCVQLCPPFLPRPVWESGTHKCCFCPLESVPCRHCAAKSPKL